MELLTGLFGNLEHVFSYVLPFLFVLTVIVFFHELGHFMVARWCGVAIEVFSVGFGREIFGFTDRKGTRWKFSWIPLGGYVKFVGDENAASVPSRDALEQMDESARASSYYHKPRGPEIGRCCRRPDCEFHPCDRYIRRAVRVCRARCPLTDR